MIWFNVIAYGAKVANPLPQYLENVSVAPWQAMRWNLADYGAKAVESTDNSASAWIRARMRPPTDGA